MSYKQVNIKIAETVKEDLKRRAISEGISFTDLINQLAVSYLYAERSETSSLNTDCHQTNTLEAQGNQLSTDNFLLGKSNSLDQESAFSVEVSLIANRLTLLENYILSLQNQLLKSIAEFEKRFSSLEVHLANHSPQLDTFFRQNNSQQTDPFQTGNTYAAGSNQRMQSVTFLNQNQALTQSLESPISGFRSSTSVQPLNTPSVDTPSTLSAVPRRWLNLTEAYAIAQQGGYRLSMCAFRLLATHAMKSIQEYGKYGLGVDPTHRGKAGIAAKWFYLLEEAHL